MQVTKKRVRDLQVGEKEEKKRAPAGGSNSEPGLRQLSLNEEGLLRSAATDQASDFRRHVGKQKQQTAKPSAGSGQRLCQRPHGAVPARHQDCRAFSQRGLCPTSQPNKESIYARGSRESAAACPHGRA